jgi:hypothetical protein
MNVIDRDGQAEPLHLLCAADGIDLANQKRSELRAEKSPVEFRSPDEVIIELVMGVSTELIARDLARVFGKASGRE